MLARRTTLEHPIGTAIDMPRLVPSFSSKGFPFFTDTGTGRRLSEVANVLQNAGPTITDSILLSAYDISHGYLRTPEVFYGNKELVVIDSGGYELSPDFDSSEPKQGPHNPDDTYGLDDYRDVLIRLPTNYPIAVTNFDHDSRGKGIEQQIQAAQGLFNQFPHFIHDFIIRPVGRQKYLDVDAVVRHVANMRRFHIVGVTEKELGSNLLDRLTNIAILRLAMVRKSVEAPLHIWGGLDPLLSLLYFCAGAEIFDGVSWLRYGYYEDKAISREAYNVLESGVQTQWRRAEAMRLGKNIGYLETLTTRMRIFVDSGGRDFRVFETHAKVAEQAYRALCTRIPELKGGA